MRQPVTQLVATQTKSDFDRAVRLAADLLRSDELVGVPTETVYGLAANALSPQAVAKIFAVKGRPRTNPLIVHVGDWRQVEACVEHWGETEDQIARAFWPGPLTVVVRKSDRVPAEVTAGGMTVALRWPSHPFMKALVEACGFPLAAPSANRSNALSPTQASHVMTQLEGRIPLVVDGGPAAVGIESTVVDLVRRPAAILRPGMIHVSALRAACPGLDWTDGSGLSASNENASDVTFRSPGQLKRHYAPQTPLRVARWTDHAMLEQIVKDSGVSASEITVIAYECVPDGSHFLRVSLIPHDAEAYARALFSELHLSDLAGGRLILVEAPPRGPEWAGIRDRLQRATQRGE